MSHTFIFTPLSQSLGRLIGRVWILAQLWWLFLWVIPFPTHMQMYVICFRDRDVKMDLILKAMCGPLLYEQRIHPLTEEKNIHIFLRYFKRTLRSWTYLPVNQVCNDPDGLNQGPTMGFCLDLLWPCFYSDIFWQEYCVGYPEGRNRTPGSYGIITYQMEAFNWRKLFKF